MWKPQVTPLSEVRMTQDGPVATVTSLTSNKQEFRSVSSKYNSKAAPFQQVGSKKMVNSTYNTPMPIYSDDAIAETLTAQAEVLGQGVIGVNFMKNEKTFEGHKSDVLKMVQEMDCSPRPESPGIVIRCGSPSIGISHEAPVQGQSFKMLERYLGGEPTHSPVSPSSSTVIKPGENICSACGSLIVGVFVRIKNKNLHDQCFKCATCGMSLKNKGYYHVNDKAYCEIHAAGAARQNPPGPNFEPITVGPGSPLPSGALTTAQARASKFSPHSPSSPNMQSPSPSSLYRPPTGGVKIMPSIPIPAPYKSGTELLLKECDQPYAMHTTQQKSSQHTESAVQISTQTNKVAEESVSIGSQVSISEDGESKHDARNNLHLMKEHQNDMSSKTFASQVGIINDDKLTEGRVFHSEELPGQMERSVDDRHVVGVAFIPTLTPAKVMKPSEVAIPATNQVEDVVQMVDNTSEKSNFDLIKDSSQVSQIDINDPVMGKPEGTSSDHAMQNNLQCQTSAFHNSVLGLPDLNKMQMGNSQNSSSLEFSKQESRISSSATQQYTASSSCYQSFGMEQKCESESSAGMKVTGNNDTPASGALSALSPVSPVVASPTKHVSASFARSTSSSNQQSFGASSGDINVRAHIPKKGDARFEWPPSNRTKEDKRKVTSRIPAWAPAGDIPNVPKPVYQGGPPPDKIPLLPTPPPPKDYDYCETKYVTPFKDFGTSDDQKCSTIETAQSNSTQSTHQSTASHGITRTSQSEINITKTSVSTENMSEQAPITIIKNYESNESQNICKPEILKTLSCTTINVKTSKPKTRSVTQTKPRTFKKYGKSATISLAVSSKPKSPYEHLRISPPRSVPITEPMPIINFHLNLISNNSSENGPVSTPIQSGLTNKMKHGHKVLPLLRI